MFKAGVGIGEGSDDYAVGVMAVSNALQKLHEKAEGAAPTLAIVFASTKYSHDVIQKGMQSVIGEAVPIVGASTAGEITQDGPTNRESVVVMLVASDTIHFTAARSEGIAEHSHESGKMLAEQLKAASVEELKLVTMFADGLKGNGSAIIRGILEVLGDGFTVVGGSAGDDGKFVQTFQFLNGEATSDSVVGLGISGNLTYAIGVNHGWSPVGAPRIVTDAEGAKVKTVDGLPAFNLYKDYLGDEADNLKTHTLGEVALSYPLGMYDEKSGEMLLRAPFAVDEDGAIVCGGEVPVGTKVQLMMGTKEDAVIAAKKAAETAQNALGKKASMALIFSCHVRNTLFANSEAAKGEVNAIKEVIGDDVPLVGFYTYAEQAPVGGTAHNIKKCDPEFHNETVVLVLLGEAE